MTLALKELEEDADIYVPQLLFGPRPKFGLSRTRPKPQTLSGTRSDVRVGPYRSPACWAPECCVRVRESKPKTLNPKLPTKKRKQKIKKTNPSTLAGLSQSWGFRKVNAMAIEEALYSSLEVAQDLRGGGGGV